MSIWLFSELFCVRSAAPRNMAVHARLPGSTPFLTTVKRRITPFHMATASMMSMSCDSRRCVAFTPITIDGSPGTRSSVSM